MSATTPQPPGAIPLRFWQRKLRITNPTLRNPLTIIGLVIAVAWIVIAIFAPLLAPHNPLDDSFPSLHAPSWTYPFGTDEIGRDVLSRVIYGSRQTIPLGLLLVGISLVIGATLGAIAGFLGGIIDGIVMRLSDLVFAFPPIVLAMVTTAALGRGARNAVIAIVIVSWPTYARVVRGLVRQLSESEYVLASRLLGSSAWRTLFRDVMPNVAGQILVLATLDLGNAILLLSGLSFLGLGPQPPSPDWGSGVAEGVGYFQQWWIGTFPGLAIFTVVLAFNFLGDSLRDALDPQSSWSRGGDDA
jgi:ABC-type dipeptide/oligopeptide/nickel transport system permease subunit